MKNNHSTGVSDVTLNFIDFSSFSINLTMFLVGYHCAELFNDIQPCRKFVRSEREEEEEKCQLASEMSSSK